MPGTRYLAPGWATRRIVNPLMRALTRVGISLRGSRELRVRGRVSGDWRATPVNPLDLGGERYLVAPRGATQWVRNIRVAGGGELRLGRRIEAFRAVEVADADKPPILVEYLRRWKSEVGRFFPDLGPDPQPEQIAAIAADFPVFRIAR